MPKLLKLVQRYDTKGIDEFLKKYNSKSMLNAKNQDGYTALLHASFCGHYETVIKLIEVGCDLDEQNNDGNTALIYACWYNKHKIIFKLVKAGCNIHIKNNMGYKYHHYGKKINKYIVKAAIYKYRLHNKLAGICVKYIRNNIKKFEKKDIKNLNKDVRCYFRKEIIKIDKWALRNNF